MGSDCPLPAGPVAARRTDLNVDLELDLDPDWDLIRTQQVAAAAGRLS